MVKRLRMTAVKRDSAELNQILIRVMEENGVKPWEYSLDGYQDERLCLEPDGENWQVYFGERGKKRRCKVFPSQQEAAAELVKRLGRTEPQQAGLQASMERLWKPTKIVYNVEEAIRYEYLRDLDAAAVFGPALTDTNQEVALLKSRLAKLDHVGLRAGAVRSVGKVKTTHMLSHKRKTKEKTAKMPKRIEMFGFKG